MNLRILTLLVIRLLALNMLINAIVLGVSGLLISLGRPYDQYPYRSPDWWTLAYPAILAICAFALLAFAPSIVRSVVEVDQPISFGSLSVIDCYTIGFFTVAAYLMATSIPQAANLIFYVGRSALQTPGTEWTKDVEARTFIQVFGTMALAYFLLLNARRWGIAFARKQDTLASELTAEVPTPSSPDHNSENRME